MAAGWMSRDRGAPPGGRLSTVGEVSGTSVARPAAIAVSTSATIHTVANPPARKTSSPIAGPIPSPTYNDSDRKFNASPRRASGARSAPAANTATKKKASAILVAANGERIDRHAAGRIVRRIARRAGIAKRVGPHTLRHAFITAALDAGVPLRDVQEAARHADPRTTMRYDRARVSLDRHATYIVATFLAGASR